MRRIVDPRVGLRYNAEMAWTRRTSLCAALALLAAAGCGDTVMFDTDEPWTGESSWPGIGGGKIMVTNSGDDTLSFLDPVTLEPEFVAATGRVPAEREGPHHGAASLDGAHYFVGISNIVPGSGSGPHGSHGTGTEDGYLLRYDSATGQLSGEVRVDLSPGDVRVSADGRYVLQSHFDLVSIQEARDDDDPDTDPADVLSRLAVTDVETMDRLKMIEVCPAAHGIAVAPEGDMVYMTCWASDEIAAVSLADLDDPVITRVPIADGAGGGDPLSPEFGPYAAVASRDGAEVWVSNREGKALAVYDVEAEAMDEARFTTLTSSPFFASFSADGDYLYVPAQTPDALITVERATGDVVNTLFFEEPDCHLPHGSALLADGDTLAVVCEGTYKGAAEDLAPGTVLRIDVSTPDAPALVESFDVGMYPDDLIMIVGDE